MTIPYHILIADPISKKGILELEASGQIRIDEKYGLKEPDLLSIISEYDGVIVRSQTKITRKVLEAGKKLKVIGRAGVGIDNVDVEAATENGIVVMNTPGGNTIATAEHTFSLLLALARNVPQAHASMQRGEWKRKNFEGIELFGKVLGIIGLGRVGMEVAKRALAFGMKVKCFDPYLSPTKVKNLQVELVNNLEELFFDLDFLSLHVPLTSETEGIINKENLKKCKQGIRLINCARGGLIRIEDLLELLKSGWVAGAALDVYDPEPPPADFPLRGLPNVILTPHLAASTVEAQENVGTEIASMIIDFLCHGIIRNAVNVPSVDPKVLSILSPYMALGEKLGFFMSQWIPNRIDELIIYFSGKINEYDTSPLTRAVLKGYLRKVAGKEVNEVNVMFLINTLGITVKEVKMSSAGEFTEIIGVEAKTDGLVFQAASTFYGKSHRLVQLNFNPIEASMEGILLLLENKDRPGIVGKVGTILGEHAVNIAAMSLARAKAQEKAISILNLDNVPSPEVLAQIRNTEDIYNVRLISL
ncbi:D-3-phosphoglycerate dehydrogenase [Methylacidiphilum kamchatkense Kam1]|uniref:D-3-phosphoglycerate dehydrogenase n=1 Tax=Methylacidiphilum kamchatkense Kam1 TaxID=1202785 RepID=A0A0C1UPT4_9BACT|nr:phosphoglycerate dehydrogenase [Methylacidiphilum kamchatkense]KIE57783.1 D-3-phosphoglycerate dehydrogenase [Methylacidiphilum kamchatkense Kam1]QDQ42472.1 D-3-phosphoglycerate dehydrogenase [Methylacidiphilum kamchatkense Kam1]